MTIPSPLKLAGLVRAARGRVEIQLDEGGIRVYQKGTGIGYVPFSMVTDASIANDFARRTVLVLTGDPEDILRLRLNDPDPLDLHRAIVHGLLSEKRAPEAALVRLVRGGRTIDEWLAQLDALGAGGYRGAALDPAMLASAVQDAALDGEVRAAAAYLVLLGAAERALVDAILALVEHAVPPIVLALVRLAPGGASLVNEELFAEVCQLVRLDPPPTRAASTSPAVVAALAKVRDVLREVRPKPPDEPHMKRSARTLASSDGLKWVGRSWSL